MSIEKVLRFHACFGDKSEHAFGSTALSGERRKYTSAAGRFTTRQPHPGETGLRNLDNEVIKMKSKWNVVATMLAICLITTATYAQSGNFKVRFHVPFPFTVENKTLAAGEYEVTQPTQLVLGLRNMENQVSAFERVQPAGSNKEVGGRAAVVFHRFGNSYFLVAISDGAWQSTYDFDRSSKETELIAKDPTRQPEVVSAPSNGTVVTADRGRK